MDLKIKIKKTYIPFLGFVSVLTFLGLFSLVGAQDASYILLEKIPGIGEGGVVKDFGTYLSQMFTLSLQLATVLAVVMISYGGFQYLTTESFTGKSDAKTTITNAVIGLVILLTSWLLLYTINPDLVNQTFVIPKINVSNSNNTTRDNSETSNIPSDTTEKDDAVFYRSGSSDTEPRPVTNEDDEGLVY